MFGRNNDKGIKLDGFKPVVADLTDGKNSVNDFLKKERPSRVKAGVSPAFFIKTQKKKSPPPPLGGFFVENVFNKKKPLKNKTRKQKKKKKREN